MIRTHSSRYTRRVPMRAQAPQQRQQEREPIPGISRRCKCGTVARIRQDGSLFAHNYCIHATEKA